MPVERQVHVLVACLIHFAAGELRLEPNRFEQRLRFGSCQGHDFLLLLKR